MTKQKDIHELLDKVEKVTKQKGIDLSSDEDLSIAIMNLISIEEHLFFTSQKTKKPQYLDLLNEVRLMRTDLLKNIIKDYEGEVWCISKHLLASSMRLMEVGTKELKKNNKKMAWDLFTKAYKLYSLFWAINLKVIPISNSKLKISDEIRMANDHNDETVKVSIFDKIGKVVQKAVDCCRE